MSLIPRCDNQKRLRKLPNTPWEVGGDNTTPVENYYLRHMCMIIWRECFSLLWIVFFSCISWDRIDGVAVTILHVISLMDEFFLLFQGTCLPYGDWMAQSASLWVSLLQHRPLWLWRHSKKTQNSQQVLYTLTQKSWNPLTSIVRHDILSHGSSQLQGGWRTWESMWKIWWTLLYLPHQIFMSWRVGCI